jgi:hypothetical protein
MILLYREKNCDFCDEIETVLKKLVAAYETQPFSEYPQQAIHLDYPVIKEGDTIISGKEEILAYLKRLKVSMELWQKFQSDTCYVDDDGEVC